MREHRLSAPNYDFVPISGIQDKKFPILGAGEHSLFHTGDERYTGKLVCEIEALTYVHVGSGVYALSKDLGLNQRQNEVVKSFFRSTDPKSGEQIIVIPGSSIKGAVRSVAEAISASCVCKTQLKSNQIYNAKECKVEKPTEQLCISCSIFGGMGYAARVSFSEAPWHIDESQRDVWLTKPLFEPKPFKARWQLYFTDSQKQKARGRKFYPHGKAQKGVEPHEVITKGGKFGELTVNFENLSQEECALLFLSMGLGEPCKGFRLKLGGGKTTCLGTVEFHPKSLYLQNNHKAFYKNYDANWESKPLSWIDELTKTALQKARNQPDGSKIVATQFDKLAQILHYDEELLQQECQYGKQEGE